MRILIGATDYLPESWRLAWKLARGIHDDALTSVCHSSHRGDVSHVLCQLLGQSLVVEAPEARPHQRLDCCCASRLFQSLVHLDRVLVHRVVRPALLSRRILHVQVEGQVLHHVHVTRVSADFSVVQYWYWSPPRVSKLTPVSGLSACWLLPLCVAFVLHLHSYPCAYF